MRAVHWIYLMIVVSIALDLAHWTMGFRVPDASISDVLFWSAFVGLKVHNRG